MEIMRFSRRVVLSVAQAFYTYALAVALYESGEEENRKEAVGHFAKVPTLTQKIGGKSIPIEVR